MPLDFVVYGKSGFWCALPADLRPSTEALGVRAARACARTGCRAAFVAYNGAIFVGSPDKIVGLLDAVDCPAVGTKFAAFAARARAVTIAIGQGPGGIALTTFLIPPTQAPS